MKHMIITIIIAAAVLGLVIVYIFKGQKAETPVTGHEDVQTTDSYHREAQSETIKPVVESAQPNMNTEITAAQTATFTTNMGNFTVAFYADESPKTVDNFVKLARAGFYNGVRFHRIIKSFMIQSGDPLSKDAEMKSRWGTGGPGYQFADEFNTHKLVKGSLAMANSGPNTNGSQFFIVTSDATPWLDGKHTNFGYVTDGMDVVMNIEGSAVDQFDRPLEDVIIQSITIK